MTSEAPTHPRDPSLRRPGAGERWLRRSLVAALRTGPPRGPAVLLRAFDRRRRSGRTRAWPSLAEEALALGPDAVSVDVFDTVLVRRLVGERNRLAVLGRGLVEQGLWEGTVAGFVAARVDAHADGEAPRLDELYASPPLAAVVDARAAAAAEAALELDQLRAVPGAAEGLARLRTAGVQLVFLSDMHLTPATIEGALEQQRLAAAGDRVLVSSATGRAKSTGRAFAPLPAGRTVHVGDHGWSDVVMAERGGIAALPCTSALPTDLEALVAGAGVTGGAVAGAARAARLDGAPADPGQRAVRALGSDVAGQLLGMFLLWARSVCEEEDVQHVQFLARDGALPLRMARAMPGDHWSGVELGYLHAGRRTWGLAPAAAVGVGAWIDLGTSDERAFLHDKRHRVPLASLLGRLGLHVADLGELGGHDALAGLPDDEPLPAGHEEAWHLLLADARVRELVHERSAEQLALVTDHLRQRGLVDRRLALVDVGWRGQLAWQVSAVLRHAGAPAPVHLHVGGANVAGWLPDVDIRRFAIDDRRAPLPFPQVVAAVEALTATGEAPAVGFERGDDGAVRPVFGSEEPAIADGARQLLHDAATATAAALPTRAELRGWGADVVGLGEVGRELLTTYWTSPGDEHALAATTLGYEVDDRGAVVGRVAAPYTFAELLPGRARPSRQWQEGSSAVSGRLARATIVRALQVRDALLGAPGPGG